jgi:hypothetical protein
VHGASSFVLFKGLKAMVILNELKSVYGPEALALLIVKKWRRRFHQGRTICLTIPAPLTNDLAGSIAFTLEKMP